MSGALLGPAVGTRFAHLLPALDRLRPLRRAGPADVLDRVRDVVLVCSSSRGGSSMLAELLRWSPHLLHLRAELNPFLVLAGWGHPESGTGSDALGSAEVARGDRERLAWELACEAGGPAPPGDGAARTAWPADAAWRLLVQWPCLQLDPDRLVAEARRVEPGTARGWLELLRRLRGSAPAVDPWFYDLAPRSVSAAFPGLGPPAGPPGRAVLEEPPFVVPVPWRPAAPEDLAARPLVIKTPSNAYRLDFLQALLSRARVRVLHLVRHPGAAINGLVDGWRFRGFHAHRVAPPLAIPGYVDRRPADAPFWKFDLPPGWEAWRARPLRQVAAFQWCSAHRAVLDWCRAHPEVPVHRLAFEDLVGPPAVRRRAVARLADWLGVPFSGAFERAAVRGLPPVMATAPPRANRWYERAEALREVLEQPEVSELAAELGYGRGPSPGGGQP